MVKTEQSMRTVALLASDDVEHYDYAGDLPQKDLR